MKRMTIGIDIDGTLTGAYDWLPYANQYFGKDLSPEEILHYDIHRSMDVDPMAYRSFYDSFKYLLHANNSLRTNAAEILEHLSLRHTCHYITARENDLRHTTEHWMERHGLPNIPLHMLGSHQKVETARTLGCTLFLEDRYETAAQMAAVGIPVLLFDTSYNRGQAHPLITRVQSWEQVKRYIDWMQQATA